LKIHQDCPPVPLSLMLPLPTAHLEAQQTNQHIAKNHTMDSVKMESGIVMSVYVSVFRDGSLMVMELAARSLPSLLPNLPLQVQLPILLTKLPLLIRPIVRSHFQAFARTDSGTAVPVNAFALQDGVNAKMECAIFDVLAFPLVGQQHWPPTQVL
jgi:hypothetical protein